MTITVPIPTSVVAGSSYTSSPIRCSPLSQPPVYAPTRTPSPLPPIPLSDSVPLHLANGTAQSRPIPLNHASRRTSGSSRYSTSISPLATGSARPPISPSSPSRSPTHSYSPTTPASRSRYDNSTPQATPSPPLSRSHPLLGSYPLSLLHHRMSHAHPPHSLTEGFTVRLSAIGRGKVSPRHLRCPEPLLIPFSATYYDLEDPEAGGTSSGKGKQTPWVGTVDLESHYFNAYSSSSHQSPRHTPPEYPGMRVAERGQLQILIKSPDQAVKVFVLPYDLRHIPAGGRLLVREKSYVRARSESTSEPPRRDRRPSPGSPIADGGCEKLRYALQVQFCCVPVQSESEDNSKRNGSTTRQHLVSPPSLTNTNSKNPSPPSFPGQEQDQTFLPELQKAYYLSKSIKLVFTSSLPDSSEELRTERTDEVVPPPSEVVFVESATTRKRSMNGFSPLSFGNRGEEWDLVRRKWAARREMKDDFSSPDYDLDTELSTTNDHGSDLDGPARSLTNLTNAPKSSIPQLDIPSKSDRPKLTTRGPSLLSVTSPSHIRIGSPRTSPPASPTFPANPTLPLSSPSQSTLTTHETPISPPKILSPLPRRSTFSLTLPSSPVRSTTPLLSPRPSSPSVPVVWSPASLRRGRREDIIEERELSERLRKLDMDEQLEF